jgi:alkanesulfonate monooxygenase SsuD/methylene tetrahydromethanopterin reductase-like flavin-dependent oxidoreductase (luciferase family)
VSSSLLHRAGGTEEGQEHMKISAMIRVNATAGSGRRMNGLVEYARRIEESGFPGIWVGDSLGRGRPTLDPLMELTAVAAVTERVELGISVIQVPLRHPIELAHRVQSLQALSGNRLRLGVGSGSTRADFELLGLDYETRFRTLRRSLDVMRRAWRGEPTSNGGVLATWPGCEGGPPILIGAWRSPRWISFAAKDAQGWTPSGRFSSWEDLEAGMQIYRAAGGTNAVLANVAIDLADRTESAELKQVSQVTLICAPEEARRRLRRLQQLGFDEVLLVSHTGVLDDLKRARDLI